MSKSYLCLCGHWERAHSDYDNHRCARWQECGCGGFEPDDEAMKDLEDQAKILRDDIRRGK